jgi:aspartyl-tRNA(Asn)/glutamyl-tRNA(Gln) amidotransferase subunit C
MQVDDALINKLSRLSQLEFSGEERAEIKLELEQMIGFMDKLRELDTTGVEPLLQVCPNTNAFREDEPGGMLTPEEALKNAPARYENFFTVPSPLQKP